MDAHRLTLTLDGIGDADGVLLSDFLRQLNLLQGALGKVDRDLDGPDRRPSTIYRIVELSQSSPARVVIEAEPKYHSADRRSAIIAGLIGTINGVQKGDVDARSFNYDVVEDLGNMADAVGKTLSMMELTQNGFRFNFTPDFKLRADTLLAPTTVGLGFLRGMLETINLHGSAQVFKIYPIVGPRKVTCRFAGHLRDKAIRALGHHVQVNGVMKYRADQPYAHEIDVNDIDILPDREDVSFEDAYGMARGLTGDLSNAEWLDQRREQTDQYLESLYGLRA